MNALAIFICTVIVVCALHEINLSLLDFDIEPFINVVLVAGLVLSVKACAGASL